MDEDYTKTRTMTQEEWNNLWDGVEALKLKYSREEMVYDFSKAIITGLIGSDIQLAKDLRKESNRDYRFNYESALSEIFQIAESMANKVIERKADFQQQINQHRNQ